MSIDLGGTFQLSGGFNPAFTITDLAGSRTLYNIDSSGRTTTPNQIGFTAGFSGADPGWTPLTNGAWAIQSFCNQVNYNKGGGYNTINGRFTAPVAGAYLFSFSAYLYKPTAVQGNYIHPNFWVNGGAMVTGYRLKGYFPPVGYSLDGAIEDIYYLNAGDFVEAYIYASGAGISFYRLHTLFAGFLVG